MTYISAMCVRRLHPAARITILMDAATSRLPARTPFDARCLADQLVVLETGLEDLAPRSRFLKTSMRQVVDGPFLFLDADTLPIRPFDEIFETAAPLSVAFDRNPVDPEPHFPDDVRRLFLGAGWHQPQQCYLNSGVIHFGNQPEARALGLEWHRRWKALFDQVGEYRDQPSFNSAIEALGIRPAILPVDLNAMVLTHPSLALHARILHFYTSRGRPYGGSVLDHLVNHLGSRCEIDWRAIDTVTRFGAVWAHGFRWQLGMGQYGLAARSIAARLSHRIWSAGSRLRTSLYRRNQASQPGEAGTSDLELSPLPR